MALTDNQFFLFVLLCFIGVCFYVTVPERGLNIHYDALGSISMENKAAEHSFIFDGSTEDTCRSLFTISRGPASDLYLGNGSVGIGGKSDEVLASALQQVRRLVRLRASPSGPKTDDYRVLGNFLPRLVSYGEEEDEEEKLKKGIEEKEKQPFILGDSRITRSGGVLPFVPCAIALYDDLASLASCIRRRIDQKGSLWILFMGDSKIRNLFLNLLHHTDDLFQYRISIENKTRTFEELLEDYQKIKWLDMEAKSPFFPGLRITSRFRMFEQCRPSKFSEEEELQQLQRWADGVDTKPDVLVVGYASWMLQQTNMFIKETARNTHDVMAMMLEIHKFVAPRLEKISREIRVLYLTQSRLRPHANMTLNLRAAFSDANFDFIEMEFFDLLRKHRRHHDLEGPSILQRALGASSSKVHHAPKASYDYLASPESTSKERRATEAFKDYLVPDTSSSGLWWWDTNLPINLAEIDECNLLLERGFEGHPSYVDDPLACRDLHHAGAGTYHDLVIMFLNLICNSVLGVGEAYCCR